MRQWKERRTHISGHPGAGDNLTMLRVLSTHLFLNQRLHSVQLDLAARSGAQAVELFAARQHFDYADRDHVTELASWFASNPLQPWSMHAPCSLTAKWAAPALPLSTSCTLKKP